MQKAVQSPVQVRRLQDGNVLQQGVPKGRLAESQGLVRVGAATYATPVALGQEAQQADGSLVLRE